MKQRYKGTPDVQETYFFYYTYYKLGMFRSRRWKDKWATQFCTWCLECLSGKQSKNVLGRDRTTETSDDHQEWEARDSKTKK